MNKDAILPLGTKVMVVNVFLKTHGKVFTVVSNTPHDNKHVTSVLVQGSGLLFKIKKENIAIWKSVVEQENARLVAADKPQPVAITKYRVANTANSILKEEFDTIEAAEAAIKKWAGGLNQNIAFQILTVVKLYKAEREIILKETDNV